MFGQAAKKELQYENIRVTNNAWDSNLIKVNGKFIAVNWNSSGGGAFAVIPLKEVGKAPDQVPLFRGHTAQVLDTDFNPFDDNVIASGSDDARIGIWQIPDDYSFRNYVDEQGEPKNIEPVKMLSGHTRKVGHVLFHPTAKNVLASSSLDYTVKIWDIESGKDVYTLKHPDMVTSMSFSYSGNHLVTVCRDKKLRVWDIRTQKVVSEGPAHAGAKNQRVVWLGNSDRIATTGFSKLSDRQIGIWDAFNLEKGDLGGFYTVDQSSGILMPFYDDSNKILYLVGKGDGNIRYFEFQNDELFELSEYQSIDPQRGFAAAPRRAVNVKENEVLKGYKTVNDHCIEPISFYVPRKAEVFQDDIYPDAPSDVPALSAEEWFSGKSVDGPVLFNVKSLYDGSDPVLSAAPAAASTPAPESTSVSASETNSTEGKETTSEVEAKQPVKEFEPQETKSEQTSTNIHSSTTNSQIDDVLKENKSVDKLLQKACSLDDVNDAEDPSKDTSGWDEDDEQSVPVNIKSVTPNSEKEDVAKKSDSVEVMKEKGVNKKKQDEQTGNVPVERTPTDIKVPQIEEKPSAAVEKESKPVEVENVKKEIESSDSRADESLKQPSSSKSSAGTATGAKSLGLKQSVEKLSALVLHLEEVVSNLKESNLDKDERLKSLETKIEELLAQS